MVSFLVVSRIVLSVVVVVVVVFVESILVLSEPLLADFSELQPVAMLPANIAATANFKI